MTAANRGSDCLLRPKISRALGGRLVQRRAHLDAVNIASRFLKDDHFDRHRFGDRLRFSWCEFVSTFSCLLSGQEYIAKFKAVNIEGNTLASDSSGTKFCFGHKFQERLQKIA
ncbi:hypothetical protein V5799_032008 [Amblyomma americanum]|uniref:Uncharacterized protein n=1 Tax=Amblyomma americanum TaxID=6943 RepID=A0AAQ4DSG0_AMBAM